MFQLYFYRVFIDNAKLLQQLKSGYKIKINWNNYK